MPRVSVAAAVPEGCGQKREKRRAREEEARRIVSISKSFFFFSLLRRALERSRMRLFYPQRSRYCSSVGRRGMLTSRDSQGLRRKGAESARMRASRSCSRYVYIFFFPTKETRESERAKQSVIFSTGVERRRRRRRNESLSLSLSLSLDPEKI